MANPGGNFNRNYVRKRKLIRDKKRARIRGIKRRLRLDEKSEAPKTKKEIREEKKSDNILKAMNTTPEEIHKLLNYRKEKLRKRRRNQKRKRYIKQEEKEMDIEKEEDKK